MRQTGYVIRIDGFIPVDKSSLTSQKAAIDALTAAEAGDLAPMLAVMRKTGLRHVYASKDLPDAPPAGAAATGTSQPAKKSA